MGIYDQFGSKAKTAAVAPPNVDTSYVVPTQNPGNWRPGASGPPPIEGGGWRPGTANPLTKEGQGWGSPEWMKNHGGARGPAGAGGPTNVGAIGNVMGGITGGVTGGAAGGVGGSGPAPNPFGTESGPGILESWFNQRANGIDTASQYAMKRGMETLGNQSAAAGSFNSGAARQQESDFAANVEAQRAGQLDALAGGASGEHMGRLSQMFGAGNSLAGGQAGTAGAYDLGAANSLNAANQAILSMFMGKAGVDSKSNQQGLNNLISLGALLA